MHGEPAWRPALRVRARTIDVSRTSGETTPTVRRATVLLVDDDPAVRAFMAVALRRFGHDVVESASGDAAVEAADGRPIDLVVCDLVMRGMPVDELTLRLRATDATLPFLFVSGSVDEAAIRDVLVDGAGYLAKPFTVAALGAKVAELLELRAATR